MPTLTQIVRQWSQRRVRAIDLFRENGQQAQQRVLKELTNHLCHTQYGIKHGATKGQTYESFCQKIPIVDYDTLKPYIEKMRLSQPNILWDKPVRWFAKSSGTTADVSKYIPTSHDAIFNGQYRGASDVVALYLHNHPQSNIFGGKTLTLGGSHAIDSLGNTGRVHSGDLSAIMIQNTPWYMSRFRAPSKAVALIPSFEQKLEAICRECCTQDITAFAGVPSWNLLMLKAVLQHTGQDNIAEVWPNMELFMHGGISFVPYKDEYKKIIRSDKMHYIETYNASEGFFAIQDDPSQDDMLLMLDYGVFYEFLEMSHLDDPSKAIPLEGVRCGVNYALIISTNGGLWRYMIGDTVCFTSTNPYKIKITGRTKQYINVFGEEVMVDNTDKALKQACEATGACVNEYTVAPIFMDVAHQGAHQWLIEFSKEPDNIDSFAHNLDCALQSINSDYKAKREQGSTLSPLVLTVAPSGTFYRWMSQRGKLGGQNKIPRLSNHRKQMDELLTILQQQ